MSKSSATRVVILISANVEWKAVRKALPDMTCQTSPFGEWFKVDIVTNEHSEAVVFFHGGWGKIAAAASTQYAIDRWSPSLLINLGTCGGFEGEVEVGTILLAERTVVYDIRDQMVDPDAAIRQYATNLDLSWLDESLPIPVRRSLLVSADRDLVVEEIPNLKAAYGAIAGDWESGAIAHVAARNRVRCLILRGVSDLVGGQGGEVYGNLGLFVERADEIMQKLVETIPAWAVQKAVVG